MIVSIPEAAQRFDLSVDSVRRRVRSGSLAATRDERGQWWLEIPDNDPPLTTLSHEGRSMVGVGTPLRRNTGKTLVHALEDQIHDLKARLDDTEKERRREAEKARLERESLLAIIRLLGAGNEK